MTNTEKDTFLLTLESNLKRLEHQCDNYFGVICEEYEGVETTLTYSDKCSYVKGKWVRKGLVVKLRGWILIARRGDNTKRLRFTLDVLPWNVGYVGDGLVVDIIKMYLEEKGV
jgi:hypothetical protein